MKRAVPGKERPAVVYKSCELRAVSYELRALNSHLGVATPALLSLCRGKAASYEL